jgi:transposase
MIYIPIALYIILVVLIVRWSNKQERCKECGGKLTHWDTRKVYCERCIERKKR